MRKSSTRSWLISALFLPQLAFQIPTKPPVVTVAYIELIKPLSQPRFPDRTKQALEAEQGRALEAAQAAAAAQASQQAAAQPQVVPAPPTQPTNNYKLFIYTH